MVWLLPSIRGVFCRVFTDIGGLWVEPVEHPESRKLIFDSRCGNHKIIVTRSADVLTYVEQVLLMLALPVKTPFSNTV